MYGFAMEQGLCGRAGEMIVLQSVDVNAKLDNILTDMEQFSAGLNDPNGSLGQLINNPELYQKLDAAASNIEEITRRMRPIVDDARVIASKIARDPGRIGVKGLLDRSQTGSKFYFGDWGRSSGVPDVIYYEDVQHRPASFAGQR